MYCTLKKILFKIPICNELHVYKTIKMQDINQNVNTNRKELALLIMLSSLRVQCQSISHLDAIRHAVKMPRLFKPLGFDKVMVYTANVKLYAKQRVP